MMEFQAPKIARGRCHSVNKQPLLAAINLRGAGYHRS